MPKNHPSNQHEKKIDCSHCDKFFPTNNKLIHHLYSEIGVTAQLAIGTNPQPPTQPQRHGNARNSKDQNREKNMIHEDPEQCSTEKDVHHHQPHQKDVHQNNFIASETSSKHKNDTQISKINLHTSNNLGEHAQINNKRSKQPIILEDQTKSLNNVKMKAQKPIDSQKPLNNLNKRNIVSIITTRSAAAALKSPEKVRNKTTKTQEENEYEIRYKCRLCGEDFKTKYAGQVHKTKNHSDFGLGKPKKRYKIIFQYTFLKKPAIQDNIQQNKHSDDVTVLSLDDVTISPQDNLMPQIVSESGYRQPEPKVHLALNISNDAVDRANGYLDEHQEDTIKTRQDEVKRELIKNKETDEQQNSDDIESINIPSSLVNKCFDTNVGYENHSLASSISTQPTKEGKRKHEARDSDFDKKRTKVRSNDVFLTDDDDASNYTTKHNSWKEKTKINKAAAALQGPEKVKNLSHKTTKTQEKNDYEMRYKCRLCGEDFKTIYYAYRHKHPGRPRRRHGNILKYKILKNRDIQGNHKQNEHDDDVTVPPQNNVSISSQGDILPQTVSESGNSRPQPKVQLSPNMSNDTIDSANGNLDEYQEDTTKTRLNEVKGVELKNILNSNLIKNKETDEQKNSTDDIECISIPSSPIDECFDTNESDENYSLADSVVTQIRNKIKQKGETSYSNIDKKRAKMRFNDVHTTDKHSHIGRGKPRKQKNAIFQYSIKRNPSTPDNIELNEHNDDINIPPQDDILPQIVSESGNGQSQPKIKMAINMSNDTVDRANGHPDEQQEDTTETRQDEVRSAEIQNMLDSELTKKKEAGEQIKTEKGADDIECISIPSSPIDECFDTNESYENNSLASSVATQTIKEGKRKGKAKDSNIDRNGTKTLSNDVYSTDDDVNDDDASNNTIKHNSRRQKTKKNKQKLSDISNKESSQLGSSDTDADDIIREIAFFLKKRKRNSLKRLLQLSKHKNDKVKRNRKEKIYKCKKCSIHFMDERKLRKHLYKQKHKDKKKRCVVCKLKFSKKSIKRHVEKHHMKMSLGFKDFNVITELSSSESSDTESSTMSSDDTDDDTRHLSQPQDSEPSTSNVNLTEQVENFENARNVLRTAENDVEKSCGSEARCLQLLVKPDENTEDNSEVTKSIELYKCEICDIHFIHYDTWKKHLSNGDHTIKTKTQCPKCDLNFTKSSLKKHIILHHNKNKNSIKFKIIGGFNELTQIDAQIKDENEVLEEVAHKKIQQNTNQPKTKYAIASRITKTITQTKNENEVFKKVPQVVLKRLKQGEKNTNQRKIKYASKLPKTISKKLNLRSNSYGKTLYQCRICKVCFLTHASILTHLHRKRHDMSAVESCSICHLSFYDKVMNRHFQFHHKTLKLKDSSDFQVKISPRFKNISHNLKEKRFNNSQEEKTVYSSRKNTHNACEENRNHTIQEEIEFEDKEDERKKQIHKTFIKRQSQEQNELKQKYKQQTMKKQLENNIQKTPSDTNHVDERLYKCSQCDVHYFKEQSLISHMARGRHDINEYQPCPICHYTFCGISLERHISLQHLKLQIEKFTIVNSVKGDESTQKSNPSNLINNLKHMQLKECVVVLTDSQSTLVSSTSNDLSKFEPQPQVDSKTVMEFSEQRGTLDVDIDRDSLISEKLYSHISASDIGRDTQISNIDSQPENINAASMDIEVEIKELDDTEMESNNVFFRNSVIVPNSVSSVKILSNVLVQEPFKIEQPPNGQTISALTNLQENMIDDRHIDNIDGTIVETSYGNDSMPKKLNNIPQTKGNDESDIIEKATQIEQESYVTSETQNYLQKSACDIITKVFETIKHAKPELNSDDSCSSDSTILHSTSDSEYKINSEESTSSCDSDISDTPIRPKKKKNSVLNKSTIKNTKSLQNTPSCSKNNVLISETLNKSEEQYGYENLDVNITSTTDIEDQKKKYKVKEVKKEIQQEKNNFQNIVGQTNPKNKQNPKKSIHNNILNSNNSNSSRKNPVSPKLFEDLLDDREDEDKVEVVDIYKYCGICIDISCKHKDTY